MSVLSQQDQSILDDLKRGEFDRTFWAQNIIKSAKSLKRDAPALANLETAIQSILPETHAMGSDAIKVTLHDPDFVLLESGFFSAADNGLAPGTRQLVVITHTRAGKRLKRAKQRFVGVPGTLDPIEVNYPEGSKYWWRLSTVSPTSQGETITLTFINREVKVLMEANGPFQANRDNMTRAEFLRDVMTTVNPRINFHCNQLDVKEPIDPIDLKATQPSSKTKKGKKRVGLGKNFNQLTVKGQQMTQAQAEQANIILGVAHNLNAGEHATVAAIYAAIWESALNQNADNGSYWGVLSSSHAAFAQTDSLGMATAFFKGGSGFQGGGAIALEHGGMTDPVKIATTVEAGGSYSGQAGYPGDAAAVAEAEAIVQAAGGAAGGGKLGPNPTVEIVEPYYFTIPTVQNPREKVWDGCQRLATEVNWRLIFDGPDVYYDSEMTLIKQKPSEVIHRTDNTVLDWNYDWEDRNIATQFTIVLLCDPWEFIAGEVFYLYSFGVDDASTAKRPGAWLLTDGLRQADNVSTQFTFKQPEPQKNEPAPQVVTVTTGQGGNDTGTGTTGTGPYTGVLSKESPNVTGHPELQPNVSRVVNLLLARFPDLQITSTLRPGGTSYHATGQACDLALPMSAAGIARMGAIGQWIQDNIAADLLEGIHNPTLSVKNGKKVPASFWGAATWAQHLNHIHVAA